MKFYDAVISGAGPAGCSAALFLARKGYRVLLFDKARFPREKICGDGVTAAATELLEEMGCTAADWVHLGSYILDPNRGIATMHLYLAVNASQVAAPDCDDLEDQEMMYLSKTELENGLKAGEFKILSWAAVVAMEKWLGLPSSAAKRAPSTRGS